MSCATSLIESGAPKDSEDASIFGSSESGHSCGHGCPRYSDPNFNKSKLFPVGPKPDLPPYRRPRTASVPPSARSLHVGGPRDGERLGETKGEAVPRPTRESPGQREAEMRHTTFLD